MKLAKDYEQLYYDSLYEIQKLKEKILYLSEENDFLKKTNKNKIASIVFEEIKRRIKNE